MKANKLIVSVEQRTDNFVLGSLITSSELLNESHSVIIHSRGSWDTVKSYSQRRGLCSNLVGGVAYTKPVRH